MNRLRPWLEYLVVFALLLVGIGGMLVSAAAPKLFQKVYAKRGW